MSKPEWKDAPKWAKWLAKDQSEAWYWYENEPHEVDCGWLSFSGRVKRVVSQGPSWKDTKELRQ